MYHYTKCPDCGLAIPLYTSICPYCEKPFSEEAKQKWIWVKDKNVSL